MSAGEMDIDALIGEFDKGLRTVFGVTTPARSAPHQSVPEAELGAAERARAAALMRVNHCGEICAQGLYQGQALASASAAMRAVLDRAAREEADHLAWCAQRIEELGDRQSLLNPLWYLGALALGYAAGRAGDDWSLGFLAETERQVEHHLGGHLEQLDARDLRTRATLEAMQREEAVHAKTARALGARDLPPAVRRAMQLAARAMTTLSARI